jgi:hypothetical protein
MRSMNKLFLSLTIFLNTTFLFAQKGIDTTVVGRYSQCLSVHVYTSMRSSVLAYQDLGANANVRLAANEAVNIGIGLTWRWLELDVGLPLPNVQQQEQFGTTQRLCLFTVMYPRKWAIEGYYGRFKGFYVQNPSDLDMIWFQKNTFFR